MKVAIAGSSGFVGTALLRLLVENKIQIIRLVRDKGMNSDRRSSSYASKNVVEVKWDPESNYIDTELLETIGLDAIVNLAGENVHKRWTPASQKRIRYSRIKSSALLSKTILNISKRPKVFVSASGISYYNNIALASGHPTTKSEHENQSSGRSPLLDESSPAGSGFLSKLAQDWEAATKLEGAMAKFVRIVHLRIGIVLGFEGGVLAKLLPLFKLGLGAKWGSGRQYMSWISIHDLARIIYFALLNEAISGPVNAVTPNPVTNREFTETLGKVLSRPTPFTIPSGLAKLLFGGEWAESTLLADYRIQPAILARNGFKFNYPKLEPFLREEIRRRANT